MNQRNTHNHITKALFPHLNSGLIDATNEKIDNVPMWMKTFQTFQNRKVKTEGYKPYFKNPYDVFNLTKKGHRSRGHDLLSASLLGAIEARKRGLSHTDGLMSAYSHLAADTFSNHLIKMMGVEGRNLYESLYMWTMRNRKY